LADPDFLSVQLWKISVLTSRNFTGNSEGGGRKLKCLKKRMKLKWNFQRGGGQNKRENLSEQDTLFQEEGSYGLVGQPVISV